MNIRQRILERLSTDLLGPLAPDEVIPERPTDRYLTGILWPRRSGLSEAEQETIVVENSSQGEQSEPAEDGVTLRNVLKPASAGISFAVRVDGPSPTIRITIAVAMYDKTTAGDPPKPAWARQPYETVIVYPVLPEGHVTLTQANLSEMPAGTAFHLLFRKWRNTTTVTATLINTQETPRGHGTPDDVASRSLYQAGFQVESISDCQLVARPSPTGAGSEDDAKSAAVIYRDAQEFATGHTCSADWETSEGRVCYVQTSWLPTAIVPATSASGDDVFSSILAKGDLGVLSTAWLSDAPTDELLAALTDLAERYGQWIAAEASKVPGLPTDLRDQAEEHIRRCQNVKQRMLSSVTYLRKTPSALAAFRFANGAMGLQREWSEKETLRWRPFQLAFILLALESTANRTHGDRATMDLLWFPTGGGKTEAYLCLTAFALAIRRLQGSSVLSGDGVAVIMRYTLRLLTIQQFQRAAAMVVACELLRNSGQAESQYGIRLGHTPFSIGLWVGGSTTPNKAADVVANPQLGQPDHRQLKTCPSCGKPLQWAVHTGGACAVAKCVNSECVLKRKLPFLPVWTVDDDVYRECPSLLISTVDKFAQIVRNADTTVLFGNRTTGRCAPPDLIIQDELHLISGPLGSLAGLYESAIDSICSSTGWKTKIIGSTATIRRATEQVKNLFSREACQFPPPVIDRQNSCFSVEDTTAAGRLYLGVTSAGRSAKFALQAVCAALLQAAGGIQATPEERDPYTTLVAYFNSLRELGGALVMMHDDVPRSITAYAERWGEDPPRSIKRIGELTSRVSATEIPDILKDLSLSLAKDGHYDVTLASNMISVGVDVPRLGAMVVNGQPKSFAEYIQATSRVGRGKVAGLVITIYNTARNRDRSHYETFRTWHGTLYRGVEATSVTPFAPRAQDKALHAIVVALGRHLVPGLLASPKMDPATRFAIEGLAARILERVRIVDPDEEQAVAAGISRFIQEWSQRSPELKWYWNDRGYKRSLLISAEVVAALAAAKKKPCQAVGTPNSLRDVEASAEFVLVHRQHGGQTSAN